MGRPPTPIRLIAGPVHSVQAAAPEYALTVSAWAVEVGAPAAQLVLLTERGGEVSVRGIDRYGEAVTARKELEKEGWVVAYLRVV